MTSVSKDSFFLNSGLSPNQWEKRQKEFRDRKVNLSFEVLKG